MKSLLIFILLCSLSSYAELNYKFDLIDDSHFVDELHYFQLQSTSEITIGKLPVVPNLEWIKTKYSQKKTKIGDEKVTIFKAKLQFVVRESGQIKLPAIEAKIGNADIFLKPEKFEVKPRRTDSEYLVQLLYNGQSEPDEYFVEQSVNIDLLVFKKAGSKSRPTSPEVNLKNAKLYKYRNGGLNFGAPKSSVFYNFSSGKYQDIKNKEMDGKNWDIRRYRVTAQLMRSGSVSGEVLTILNENGRQFPLTNKLSFKVKDIPASTEKNTINSGLAGKWEITSKLSTDSLEADKSFEYVINFKGHGDLRRLKIPVLNIPGIKVIDSQLDKTEEFANEWKGTLTYKLYPSTQASQFPEMKMSYFNIESEKHEIIKLNDALKVKGGLSVTKPESYQRKLSPNDLTPGQNIRKPLYLNLPPWLAILFFISPLIFICTPWLTELLKRSDIKQSKDLLKRRSKLLKKCESASEDQIPQLIQKELIPYLIDIHQLPTGSTVEEILPHLKCDKLKQLLINYNQSSYSGKKADLCPGTLKNAINNLSIAVVLLFSTFSLAGETKESLFEQANNDYKEAKYTEAVEKYKKLIEDQPNNDAIHYNLGNAYFQNEDFHRARASYHTALMLNPSHEGSIKNLKTLNEETSYQGPPRNPLNFLRSDHWLALFIVVWAIFWLTLTILKVKKKRLTETAYGGLGVLGLLSVILYFQIAVSYAEGRFQVISDNALCYDKPGTIGTELKKIPPGTEFLVIEEKENFSLVQSEGRHFWLRTKDLQKIW